MFSHFLFSPIFLLIFKCNYWLPVLLHSPAIKNNCLVLKSDIITCILYRKYSEILAAVGLS